MAFSDQSALFQTESLLTWQLMDQMADNDAALHALDKTVSFVVYCATNQSLAAGINTKVQLDTEEYDSDGYFDSATNYRFTPLVAGLYQFAARVRVDLIEDARSLKITLIKNGGSTSDRVSEWLGTIINPTDTIAVSLCCLAQANGTTDYFELFAQQDGTTANLILGGAAESYFAGALVAQR